MLFNLEGARREEEAGSCGPIAQLEEHLLCKQGVTGSSPVTSTRQDRIEVFKRLNVSI